MLFEKNGGRKKTRTSSLVVFSLLFMVALSTAWTAARSQSDGASPLLAGTAEPTPPVAKRSPKVLREHGHERIDDYPWFRDRKDPDTLAYLQAENVYATHRLARLSTLIEEIARELRERADGADENLEFVDTNYIYERRFVAGARHPTIVRRPAAGGPEETVLGIEQLAAGHENYSLDDYIVSPDGKTVAFAVDTLGDLRYRILLRHIPTGAVTDTGIADVSTGMVFSADSQHLFYIRLEQDLLRSFQLWRHQLGTARSEDRLIYEETDRTFELRIQKTKSGRYILLHSVQQQSTEIRYLAADRPHDSFRLMEPRRHGHIYDADHSGGRFFIRTNSAAPDFRVATAPEASPEAAHWQDFIAQTPGRVISRMEAFNDFVALVEQHDALQSVRILRLADSQEIAIPRPAEIGVMDISSWQNVTNRNPAASVLHMRFAGPLHPPSLYDVDIRTGTRPCAGARLPRVGSIRSLCDPSDRGGCARRRARAGDVDLSPR